jgi:hypothetical protein
MSLQRVAFSPLHTFTRATNETFFNRVVDSFGNVSYQLQTAPAGTAVQNAYNPATGEPLGLQVFEQRTNIATRNKADANALDTWIKTNVTVGVVADPKFGNVIELTDDATDGLHDVVLNGAEDGVVYTRSIRVKKPSLGGWRYFAIASRPGTSLPGNSAYIDLDTGLKTSGGLAVKIESIGDGWLEIDFTAARTGVANRAFAFGFASGAIPTNNAYAGTGSKLLIALPQNEAGAFKTPPIETEAAAATRNASVAVINDIDESEWFNPSEGTFVVEWVQNSVSGRIFSIQSAVDQRIGIMPNDAVISAIWFNGGAFANYANSSVTTASIIGQEVKAAVSFTTGKVAISVNGQATVSIVTTNPTPPFVDKLTIGSHEPAITGNFINGQVANILYYPTAVSDAKLQELSTL